MLLQGVPVSVVATEAAARLMGLRSAVPQSNTVPDREPSFGDGISPYGVFVNVCLFVASALRVTLCR